MTAWTAEHVGQIRSQLERVAAGGAFSTSGRMPALLRHLVEAELNGAARRLSQTSIAIDVFNRDQSFDPAVDSIVRVEMGRLRNKLREYYTTEGSGDSGDIRGAEGPLRVIHRRESRRGGCPTIARTEAGVTFLLDQGRNDHRIRNLRRRLSTGEGGELVEPPGIRLPESHLAALVGRTGRAFSPDPLRRARLRTVRLGCRRHLLRSPGSTISSRGGTPPRRRSLRCTECRRVFPWRSPMPRVFRSGSVT